MPCGSSLAPRRVLPPAPGRAAGPRRVIRESPTGEPPWLNPNTATTTADATATMSPTSAIRTATTDPGVPQANNRHRECEVGTIAGSADRAARANPSSIAIEAVSTAKTTAESAPAGAARKDGHAGQMKAVGPTGDR